MLITTWHSDKYDCFVCSVSENEYWGVIYPVGSDDPIETTIEFTWKELVDFWKWNYC